MSQKAIYRFAMCGVVFEWPREGHALYVTCHGHFVTGFLCFKIVWNKQNVSCATGQCGLWVLTRHCIRKGLQQPADGNGFSEWFQVSFLTP